MPKKMFRVTYELVTPESAEQADCAECGFMESDGSKVPLGREANHYPFGLFVSRATRADYLAFESENS